ncbi:MAG: acetyl-CoA carboxylase biotin carboxylase subunit [Gammaproteobacteria bacterium]
MFKKILIANRGEIACRVIKTAHQLGIECVAVYSEVDQNALHVKMADEAYCIGPAPSQESYLNITQIIKVAQQAKPQAIHPGYGFLAENAAFAQACIDAGLIFIGPSPKAMALMGEKGAAKALMIKNKIPCIPGYHEKDQSEKALMQAADNIGYPILLKAACGGGGKGMRTVEDKKNFVDALAAVKREAQASFNDDRIILEKHITQARHIEIQILADQQGHCIHLFERECSIQRRHQKIIEEAPACNLSGSLRQAMGEVAIQVAQAVNYTGAGTVEFLLDNAGSFYFMEMNTRLQVEHPVTEMITGLDLVAWQLRIADGEKLDLQQEDLIIKGHAIELRLCAEDPYHQFLPSSGKIDYLELPINQDPAIRIDSAMVQGDTITPYYDSLLAKIISWDEQREVALNKLRTTLNRIHLVGIKTNQSLLSDLLQLDDFVQGQYNTSLIIQHEKQLLHTDEKIELETIVIATLYLLLQQKMAQPKSNREDDYSPWQQRSAWRMNLPRQQKFILVDDKAQINIEVEYQQAAYQIKIHKQLFSVTGTLVRDNLIHAYINQKHYKATIIHKNNKLTIFSNTGQQQLSLVNLAEHYSHIETAAGQLNAPMPGTIVAVHVHPGDQVKSGDDLITLEAMKMEHTIYAPSNGKIEHVNYQCGDQVNEGSELLTIEAS